MNIEYTAVSSRTLSPDLSLVVPMYNEESCVDRFFENVLAILNGTCLSYEVICVDDGSSDATVPAIREWMRKYPNICLVRLTRNFGKEMALAAALDHASGAAVIPIDADLQDPPELIPQMIELWQQGAQMVVATRRERPGDSKAKRLSANGFYRVMNLFSEVSLPGHAGDFRLMDRKVVDAIRQLPEATRFHKGLYAWLGFKTYEIEFERPARQSGNSKWNYWRLWNYALDGLFSFTTAPLKVWSYLGSLVALSGFVYAGFMVLRTLIQGIDVPGYASLLVLMLILNGLTMIGVGVVGEYVGRIFTETKRRPKYLVDEIEPGNSRAVVLVKAHERADVVEATS